jgi:UDP-N-acetylmuramate--alanine ligase
MKIHFIGIGGIGVSALVQYYLAKGHKISGSDLASSEITEFLKKKGIKLFIGKHKVKNLPKDVDLVIYSPAIKISNPELKKAQKLKIENCKLKIKSYPEALGELTKQHFTIAVSGTHGKSTTTAMIGLILIKAGFNPTVVLGTKLKEFGNSNFHLGGNPKSKILVIEACEHFASFLNYWPKIIVLTNIEKDHLDYYKNLNNILKTFKKYIDRLPNDGLLVANKDDKIISNIFSRGREKRCYFSLRQKEAIKIRKILKIPGEHNVSNALAALTIARALKISDKISFKALSEFRGSWRRFERRPALLKRRAGLLKFVVISDYAHHPTEIRATLSAARGKYPQKKIWCIYQPHQYQRTYYLFKDFVKVFRDALTKKFAWAHSHFVRPKAERALFACDKLMITDIYDVAGREEKGFKKKVDAKKLVKAINSPMAMYLVKKDILNFLKKNLQGGEVVIIMGAGDIYKLGF